MNIELANSAHTPEIIALLQQDGQAIDHLHFEKKYSTHPNSLRIIAIKDEKVVGFLGTLAVDYEERVFHWATDAIIHPDYRKQGIATQLLQKSISLGVQVAGVGIRNEHILKAELNAGFKLSTHLHTFTAFPIQKSRLYVQKITPPTHLEKSYVTYALTKSIDYLHQRYENPCYEWVKSGYDELIILKKELGFIRIMDFFASPKRYPLLAQQVATTYQKRVRFLQNTKYVSPWKALRYFCIPARKPEKMIYTHPQHLLIPVSFGDSDWFME